MPTIDWIITIAGFGVGTVVGLTGMGGGALMTPVLVLLFGVPPNVAVSSDLAASLFMKPLGAWVHFRRGTVNGPLVRYLVLGSVPAAFGGAALINHMGNSEGVNGAIKTILGVALLVAATASVLKSTLAARHAAPVGASEVPFALKPGWTVLIGAVGGFIVGMTSVGSGSLVIVMLMLLYPRLTGSRLVGTDLVQAIPLVGAAALGHVVFGHVKLDLTASLLLGSIPGVYLGAHFSARSSDTWIRPVLVTVLVVSALKLLGASNQLTGYAAASIAAGTAVWALTRRGALPSETEEAVARVENALEAPVPADLGRLG